MIKRDFSELEQRRLLELAREYRNLGYTVITKPTRKQLPDFLTRFQPDMLAYNEQENVVLLVRSQRTLPVSPDLEGIATAIQEKKGWRFELVVTNPREKDNFKTASESLLNAASVLERLQESQHLSEQEHGEAAFLLAWSAVEAVLRQIAAKENLTIVRSSSEELAKNLFTHGVIDREQYDTLSSGVTVRNSLIHGYQDPPAYATILNRLIAITQQLLNEEQLAPA